MKTNKNKLYFYLFLACIAGYIWLFINYTIPQEGQGIGVCLIKHTTNIPCPSCGSTRSILSLLEGNIPEAFAFNPIGIVLFMVLIITPFWIVYDLLFRKNTLLNNYLRMEVWLRRKSVYIPAIMLIFVNWMWNIYKDL